MKKIILIIAGVVLGGLVIFGGIYASNRSKKQADENTGGVEDAGSLPLPNNQQNTAADPNVIYPSGEVGGKDLNISDVVEFAITSSTEILAVKSDGKIIKSSGTESILSNQKILNLLDASFSFNSSKVLIKSGSPSSPSWSVYDIPSNSWRQLSIEARDASWSPGENKIAYVQKKSSGLSIQTLDLQNSKSVPKTFVSMNAEDLIVSWISLSKLLVSERPSAMARGAAWVLDLKNNSLNIFIENARGLEVVWDGNGQGLLFQSGNNGKGGILSLVSESGGEIDRFSFLTLPNKCSFFKTTASSSDKIYFRNILCAIPEDSAAFSGAYLPDDYEAGGISIADNFYSVNLEEGTFSSIKKDNARQFIAERLRVSGKSVYFINRLDKRLYSLPL